jgi:hypothetical protein
MAPLVTMACLLPGRIVRGGWTRSWETLGESTAACAFGAPGCCVSPRPRSWHSRAACSRPRMSSCSHAAVRPIRNIPHASEARAPHIGRRHASLRRESPLPSGYRLGWRSCWGTRSRKGVRRRRTGVRHQGARPDRRPSLARGLVGRRATSVLLAAVRMPVVAADVWYVRTSVSKRDEIGTVGDWSWPEAFHFRPHSMTPTRIRTSCGTRR